MGSGGKQGLQRWKISLHWSPCNLKKQPPPPHEFICPISGSLMADPVIVSSGHTFERNCVQACLSLHFNPLLPDGSTPDFSTIIPNLALKSTILNWCRSSLLPLPIPLDFPSALKLVQASFKPSSAYSELARNLSSTSEESVAAATDTSPTTPRSLTTLPFCYSSSSSSSEIETPTNPNKFPDDDEIILKLRSSQVFDQEEAVITLRKITRAREDNRVRLCTPRLLSALRSLMTSRYSSVQVNSVAALVNLSLENTNKVMIVRSGIIPPLIDVLRGGFPEAQDHATGALFSLALDDQNKTAIGVLGALPPLLHALRSESEQARHDSALALYHLSLVQSNRAKLVKLGSVQTLLGMVKSGHMTGRIMLVLCNLAESVEGRTAMLDAGVVECFIGMLSRGVFDSESTRETCVAALYGLSHGGMRFKGLAKEAGAEMVLMKAGEMGSDRSRLKARKVLDVMTQRCEEEEDVVDWEALLNSGEVTQSRFELGC